MLTELNHSGKRTRGRLFVYHKGDPDERQRLRREAKAELADGYGLALLQEGVDPDTGLQLEVWNVVCIRHLH